MARLLHLNGPPGIGKSTLARRYAGAHPGVLCCDIDALRTMIGGWRDDFVGAGAVIRPAALALIGAHLGGGRDVVLPQMIVRPEELARFEALATERGATYHQVLLTDDRDAAVARFERRGAADADSWHHQVRSIVAEQGGAGFLADCHERLEQLAAGRPDALVVSTVEGAHDAAYDAVVSAFSDAG